jgi:type I restriction enzyme S subunit
VTASDFEAARVLLPKRHLIDQFDEIASPVISQIQNLRQQSRKLAEARDLLLPRLMNGEIAV